MTIQTLIHSHIWTGLEAEYRLTLARQQELLEQKRLQEESTLVTNFRYADLEINTIEGV
ncbi:MAG: hypothetical protein LWX08_09770 [Deltaproteobacteria bacterium]|jgi:HTH-type transcriptional regulator/antitoxin HigA|nr:hypothetical protein [Deltaproteobacteria bacterium]